MNLFKIINLQSKEQKKQICFEAEQIMIRCERIADNEMDEQKKEKEFSDNNCPKCRAKKDSIVDKICFVNGKGDISGSLNLGFGNVNGNIIITTDEVNHCNGCGNQWKKFKIKNIGKNEILRVAFKYLLEILNNSEEKRHSWKMETLSVFNDCHAEAIYYLYKKYVQNTYSINTLQLSQLRKYYQSVFNNTPKKLKEL